MLMKTGLLLSVNGALHPRYLCSTAVIQREIIARSKTIWTAPPRAKFTTLKTAACCLEFLPRRAGSSVVRASVTVKLKILPGIMGMSHAETVKEFSLSVTLRLSLF